MQRLYALAAELNVPIVIHFQEFSPPGGPGTFNTGFKKFDAMLKALPKTTFVGHADAFWANVSADYAEDTSHPTGRIKPGGVTDRFLGEHPNLYADISANSGNNFLTRDPEFAARFIERHQNKVMFGSDCPCPETILHRPYDVCIRRRFDPRASSHAQAPHSARTASVS